MEMIERVAVAIKEQCKPADGTLAIARVAIEAMREPDTLMILTGMNRSIPEEMKDRATVPKDWPTPISAKHIYQAMIDAALASPERNGDE